MRLLLIVLGALALFAMTRPAPFPPAVIADDATGYSQAQLEYMRVRPFDIKHDHFEDLTFVPKPISYVRIEYLASKVDKPFPKIFIADAAFPANTWTLEFTMAVPPETMPAVFSTTDDLPCAADSADLNAGADRFEIRIRKTGGPLKRCLVDRPTGCRYVAAIRLLTHDEHALNPDYPKGELAALSRRIPCA